MLFAYLLAVRNRYFLAHFQYRLKFKNKYRHDPEELVLMIKCLHKILSVRNEWFSIENDQNAVSENFEDKYDMKSENLPYCINFFEEVGWFDPFP
jgi:hypothetical protein